MKDRDFDPFAQFSQRSGDLSPRHPHQEHSAELERPIAQEKAEPISSASSGEKLSTENKRPKLVSAIAIFYALSTALALFSFVAIRKDWVRLSSEEASYMAQFGTFSFLWGLLLGSVSLYAVICLFQLRALAERLFLILLIVGLINGIWYAITTDWLSYLVTHPQTLIGSVIGEALSLGVWFYAHRLKAQGVLT